MQTTIPSDTVTLALYALYGSLATGVFACLLALINNFGQRRAEKKADIVAVKAEEVKEVLAKKAIATDEKLDSIHVLVNSDMGKEKLKVAKRSRRIADLTKDPLDIAIAEEDEAAYAKHQASQGVVDTAAAAAAAGPGPNV